jgi:hypothetical protein
LDVEGFVDEIFYRKCKKEGLVGELAQSPYPGDKTITYSPSGYRNQADKSTNPVGQ